MKSVRAEVCELIADTFEVRADRIRPELTWKEYGADSLDLVELILALEERFDISFESAELGKIQNVDDLVLAIEQKRGNHQA